MRQKVFRGGWGVGCGVLPMLRTFGDAQPNRRTACRTAGVN
ncbi:hypothetical protein BFG60_2446 [Microcystis aeruginosa NIES-98]|nr:hypothetical protein BFG60_2446 [Microcystis aeruginosa NIES-98]